MAEQHMVDMTELAILGEQFPLRLMQLGFRVMQVMDAHEQDHYRYVMPPVCDVPAGSFLMGSDKQRDSQAYDVEIPQHEVFVPPFQIGTYPMTVAEYACAVQAGKVEAPGTDEDVTWQGQQEHPDHPVVCITWDQAMDYAAWLAQVTGQPWRLPTDAEWEKATRGIDGRIFPWGDEWDGTRANTKDGGPGTTTPIGAYAGKGDVSPYGAHDMSGNVWEWTSSPRLPDHDDRAENDADTTSMRVLRGGSWGRDLQSARAACRNSNHPTVIYSFIGVRLVRGDVAG